MLREAIWTESVAVGCESIVREIGAAIDGRLKMMAESAGPTTWAVREDPDSYGTFSGLKTGYKGTKTVDSLS